MQLRTVSSVSIDESGTFSRADNDAQSKSSGLIMIMKMKASSNTFIITMRYNRN